MSLISDAATAVDAVATAKTDYTTKETALATASDARDASYITMRTASSFGLDKYPNAAAYEDARSRGLNILIIGPDIETFGEAYAATKAAYQTANIDLIGARLRLVSARLTAAGLVDLALKDFQQRYKCPC